jgi:hypothetical protein
MIFFMGMGATNMGTVVDTLFSLLHPPSESHHILPALVGMVGAVASLAVVSAVPAAASVAGAAPTGPTAPDDVQAEEPKKQDELKRRKMETAVMPAGVRDVVAGSGTPVWLYARMLTAASPEAGFQPDAELTDGIRFRVASGGDAVVLGDIETVGDWVAVGVAVERTADGPPLPETILVAVERFSLTGQAYHRRTIALRVLPG